MRWYSPLVVVFVFSITLYAETFDLGDLKQYDPKTDQVPDGVEPDSIYIVEEDDGFKILLGQDVKAKVDGAIQGCGEMNNECFQTINNLIRDAHVQIDQDLEPRQLLVTAAAVGEAFQGLAKLAGALVALIMALNSLDGKQLYNEKGSHWSDGAANNVAKLPEDAPITISAAGSAIATVTQASIETTLEGSTTPVVTVVQSANDGFEKGDLSGVLDADLAGRLDEFIHRSKDCQAGWDFDKEHPPKKRAAGTYGQALCGAQGVMQGATANGPFNDLVLLDPAGVDFQFVNAEARAAGNQLAEFVKAYAPLIAWPEGLLDRLSPYVLALAIDTLIENIPLGEQNRIKATMVTTTDSPASTSTGCPKPNSIICGMEGEDCSPKIVGEGDDKKAVCKEGKHKDCKCNLPIRWFINRADKERQKLIGKLNSLFDDKEPEHEAECPSDKKTMIPASIFSSESTKVHGHFCDDWNKDDDKSMTADSKGKNIEPETHLRERVVVDSDTYRNFMFDLSFKKAKGGDECSRSCNEAFEYMSKACATFPINKLLPGQALPIGSHMYEEGSLDVGCGTFNYKIHERELTELKEYNQFCYKTDDFPKLAKAGVNKKQIGRYADVICEARRYFIIKKGDKSTFLHGIQKAKKVPYQYNVWWKDGCTLADNGSTWMYVGDPLLEEGKPNDNTCRDNLHRNWKDCNNGGVGGRIQIGCLIYEFKADPEDRTW